MRRDDSRIEGALITCEAVIAESCYLLRNLSVAPEAVIENIAAGILQIAFQLSRESAGVKHLLRKYHDRNIDLAGACLIRLADEFGTADILTLDRVSPSIVGERTSHFECCRVWGFRRRYSG